MFSHKRCCHGLFLKQKAYGDSLHQYLPQAVRGNTFTNCLTTQEAFCWTLGVPARANASPAWRPQLALKKESAVAGGGAVNGIQQGRLVISPQAGNPALTLSPASLIKCGVCWTGPETATLRRWRTQTLLHIQFTFRQEHVWLQGEDERSLAIMLVCDSVGSCMVACMGKDRCPPIGSNGLLTRVKPDSSVAHQTFYLSLQCCVAFGASVLTPHLLPTHAAHAYGHACVHM